MAPKEQGESSEQRFAEMIFDRGVLTARLTGPSVGQREGEVVAAMIQARLEAHRDDPGAISSIVLDFSDISFINSAGLGSCVVVHQTAKSHGAAVVLYAMQTSIRDVFTMTRLDKIFKIAADEERLEKILGK